MTFREGLDEHLAAIVVRDPDRFAATLSDDADARVIAPDGSALVGRAAILAAHREWFASDAWTFEPRVVFARASVALGFALLDVNYREGATHRRFLLSVVFTLENGRWRLLYDQNTPLS